MSGQPQAKLLLATLTECESARGNVYLRGWLGASNLVGFRGEDDDQGRPTWNLYLVERQPKEDGRATEPASAGTTSASSYRALQAGEPSGSARARRR